MPLPILIYHQIADHQGHGNGSAIAPNDWPYRLDRDVFEAQIRSIYQQRMRTVVMEELTVESSEGGPLASMPSRPVCLTFDDGSISDYAIAYPTLLSYGQRATFFVITDRIGQPGYVSWDQLREMAANGMSIQSHSCTHAELAHGPSRQAREELLRSKERLEQALGRRITAFAAPGGSWRPDLSALAEECGYALVCTSEQGVNEEPFERLALKRLSIRRRYSLRRVHSLLMGRRSVVLRQQFEAFCFESAKNALGGERYNSIRQYLLARAVSRAHGALR
jgi:peptidoglycan/xylan/chitin deacetylase (PgdA/CDA1 family)